MGEPASGVVGSDRDQGCCDGGVQSRPGARCGGLNEGLDLAEGLLDRRQVRRVGGQKDQPAAGSLNQLAHAVGFVRADVVDHHHLSRPQRGNEHLLQIGGEHRRGGVRLPPSSPGSSRPATARRSAWSPDRGCGAPPRPPGCREARGRGGGSSRCACRTRRGTPARPDPAAAWRCATGRERSRRARWRSGFSLQRPARPPLTPARSSCLTRTVGRQAGDRP